MTADELVDHYIKHFNLRESSAQDVPGFEVANCDDGRILIRLRSETGHAVAGTTPEQALAFAIALLDAVRRSPGGLPTVPPS